MQSPTLQSTATGFDLAVRTPREGAQYRYHGYVITIHEPMPAPRRFRKFQVHVRHEICGTFRRFPLFATTVDELRNELRPVLDAHNCGAKR